MKTQESNEIFVGIDISKQHLDVAIRPTGETFQVGNDEDGIAQLIERMKKASPALIVMEATGGYETTVASALGVAGIPLAIVNPRQARDFAKSIISRIQLFNNNSFLKAIHKPLLFNDKPIIETYFFLSFYLFS